MNQQFLAEYVDGGDGCFRDDCDVRDDKPATIKTDAVGVTIPVIVKYKKCLSCGKRWTEQCQNDIKIN
jgi:hypothetical protein